MRKIFFIFIIFQLNSLAQEKYKVELFLNTVKNNSIKVRVELPSSISSNDVFCFPAIIPGTYARYDYGRVVTKFKAYNSNGKRVKYKRRNINTFELAKPQETKYVEYWVKDTWTEKKTSDYIFQPAGTYFSNGKVFVLNFSGIVGYLQSKAKLPFELIINYPDSLYGASSMVSNKKSSGRDIFLANSYNDLVDSPMLYSKADTCSFLAGESRISFAIHSENKMVKSADVAFSLKPLTFALKDFFGKLPVSHYQFLYFFADPANENIKGEGGLGALEHNYSSVYFLTEIGDSTSIKHMVRDVSSHEFLHILTPLNVHSEEINNFDFQSPNMSQHLWMYEGVTEYFAHLVQNKSGLISQKRFMEIIREKILNSQNYPNVSFTDMSRKILSDEYKSMYANVYEKGALLAFLLDLRLKELSNGKKGLKELMLELSEEYGPTKSFPDSALFSIIVKHSYPEISSFLNDYIKGNKDLPYKEYFNKIGWNYIPEESDSVFGFGRIEYYVEENADNILVYAVDDLTNPLKLQPKDLIVMVNGTKVTKENAYNLMKEITLPEKEKYYKIELIRNKNKVLTESNTVQYLKTRKSIIRPFETINENQIKLKEWLLE